MAAGEVAHPFKIESFNAVATFRIRPLSVSSLHRHLLVLRLPSDSGENPYAPQQNDPAPYSAGQGLHAPEPDYATPPSADL